MDDRIHRFFSSSRILQTDLWKLIVQRLDPGYLLPFCWMNFYPRVFLHYFFPDSTTAHMLARVPIIVVMCLFVLHDTREMFVIVRDVYLWYCGYLPRSKATFTVAWSGCPLLLALSASALMYYLGELLFNSTDRLSIVNVAIRSAVLFFLSNIFINFNSTILATLAMIATQPLTRAVVDASSYGFAILQLVDLCDLGRNLFYNPNVFAAHQRHVRRLFRQYVLEEPQSQPARMRRYAYGRLHNDSEWIRLLRVHRGESPEKPTFSLIMKRLSDKPKYTAISYVWGKQTNMPHKYGLEVDGQWLETTRPAFEILHEHARFWKENGNELFWIDSVCINQKDAQERGAQVNIMGEIYSQAVQVIAFVQPDDPNDVDVAVHFLYSLGIDMARREKRHYGPFPKFLSLSVVWSSFVAGAFSKVTGGSPSPGWNALSRLFGHTYWTRMWIIQELALSEKLTVMYGDREIDWRDLWEIATLSPEEGQYIDTSYGSFVHGDAINETRHRLMRSMKLMISRKAGQSTTVQELFTSVKAMGATDNRDRVWALLGVLPQGIKDHDVWKNELRPQYDRVNVVELYHDTAVFLIDHVDPEWLLCMAGTGYAPRPDTPGWKPGPPQMQNPTWVPDWSAPHPTPLPAIRPNLAGNERSAMATALVGGSLHLVGCSRVARIQHVTPIHHLFTSAKMDTAEKHLPNQLWNVKRLLRDLEHYPRYLSRAIMIDALGSTLTGGQASNEALAQGFPAYFRFWTSLRPVLDTIPDEPPDALSPTGIWTVMAETAKFAPYAAQMNLFAKETDVCYLRGLAFTENGDMALVPQYSLRGDAIYKVPGVDSLFVISESNGFELVGDCYMFDSDVIDEESVDIHLE